MKRELAREEEQEKIFRDANLHGYGRALLAGGFAGTVIGVAAYTVVRFLDLPDENRVLKIAQDVAFYKDLAFYPFTFGGTGAGIMAAGKFAEYGCSYATKKDLQKARVRFDKKNKREVFKRRRKAVKAYMKFVSQSGAGAQKQR